MSTKAEMLAHVACEAANALREHTTTLNLVIGVGGSVELRGNGKGPTGIGACIIIPAEELHSVAAVLAKWALDA